jgi:hypothetical protein
MARCVIEEEKGLGIPFGTAFKDVDSQIDLLEEFVCTEIPIAVLASFEDNPSFPELVVLLWLQLLHLVS